MHADVFSLGFTLRHLVSGVPPDQNTFQYITNVKYCNLNLHNLIGRRMLCSSKSSVNFCNQRFCTFDAVLRQALWLVKALTNDSIYERCTVMAVQNFPWIILDKNEAPVVPPMRVLCISGSQLDYLSFAKREFYERLLETADDYHKRWTISWYKARLCWYCKS